MTTNNNTQQAQPKAGPIAQQLAKIQANGQQAQFNGQQPLAGQPRKKTPNWNWTGFSGKTLWDWLPLLIIPVAIALGTTWFSYQQNQTSIQLASDQQKEATLKSYLDDMADLLLNHNLRNSKSGDEVSLVARERTLTTLRRLDAKHNRIVLQFLQDAYLIDSEDAIIDLSNADLSGDDLGGVNLSRVILRGANLQEANLQEANLQGSDLSCTSQGVRSVCTDLSGAKLSGADLSCFHQGSRRHESNICTNLREASLVGADLSGADLSGASLRGANLSGANLDRTILTGAQHNRWEVQWDTALGVMDGFSPTQWPQGFDPNAAGAIEDDTYPCETLCGW